MPEIEASVTSKIAPGEIVQKVLQNVPTITLGVLTVVTLLTSAKYYPEYLVLAIPILTAVASLLIARYQNLKNKVKELRMAVDAMDDALADNTVTLEEIRDIFLKIRTLLSR
jgi:hypothetical protein